MCVAFVIRKKVLRGNAEKEKLYGHYALTPVSDTWSLCTHTCARYAVTVHSRLCPRDSL